MHSGFNRGVNIPQRLRVQVVCADVPADYLAPYIPGLGLVEYGPAAAATIVENGPFFPHPDQPAFEWQYVRRFPGQGAVMDL